MGNGQSVEAPRRPPNRLSKPRTNSSTNLLNMKTSGPPSRRNSQSNSMKRQSTISVDVADFEEAEKVELTPKKRMSMFRSKSAQTKPEPVQIETGVDIEYLDRDSDESWSARRPITNEQHYRTAQVENCAPVRPGRMSLQHVPYSHRARLSLVAEAPSPQPDPWEESSHSDNKTQGFEQKRPLFIQEEEVSKSATRLPDRKKSEPELFAPIRRRSFLQHGIATRTSWMEDDPRQHPFPSQIPPQDSEDFRAYYYNDTKSTSSPLSNIAAMAPRFQDLAPGPRTMTPNDMDYSHIGAFKLGSLRITNGAASPAPSIERPPTQGGKCDPSIEVEYSSRHNARAPRSNPISSPHEVIKSHWISRAESPLRQTHEPEELPLKVSTHLPLPEFSAFNFTSDSPTKSQDLAQGYMQELPLSPFSFDESPPRTPRLEATSKHTAMEDDLFEAEPTTPELEEVHPVQSFYSEHQAEEAEVQINVKGPQSLLSKPLAKVDSGYSSNVSLRSFKTPSKPDIPTKEAALAPCKKPISRVASSTYSVTSSYSEASERTITSKRSLPALPMNEISAPFRQTPLVSSKQTSFLGSEKSMTALPLSKMSPEEEFALAIHNPHGLATPKKTTQQIVPQVPRTLLQKHPASQISSGITSSDTSVNASRWRKKRRSQSVPPQLVYTVQAYRDASEELSVPPVPAHVSQHLEERVNAFPVTCFPNTMPRTNQLKRTVSKETLGTIFSVGSAEYREEAIFARLQSARPQIPSYETIPEFPPTKPEANRRHTLQPSSLAPIIPGKSRQSFTAIPKNAIPIKQQTQEEFETHITSYESVSSSLGKSPYDFELITKKSRCTGQEQEKSLTSQLETEARQRFLRARSVSEESLSSPTLSREKSSENQQFPTPSTASSTLTEGNPPSAHARWTGIGSFSASTGQRPFVLSQRRSTSSLADDDGKRLSLSKERMRSPPISMQTRKALPSYIGPQATSNQNFIIPSRTPPAAPSRSPILQTQEQDPWASQKSFWAERRKSAGQALKQQKSIEMRRPQTSRTSMEQQDRTPLKTHGSWDVSQGWNGYAATPGEYDHTYGLHVYEHDKENYNSPHERTSPVGQHLHQPHDSQQSKYYNSQQEEEYYDGPSYSSDDLQQTQELPQTIHTIHKRQTSTSEMLVLDRFSGGLGYGYEPGLGLGGSAGTRNMGRLAAGERKSVDVSKIYGVDFSDVPVFLTKVVG